ncbi:MAG: hypothetical protein GY765_30410 [bacterium]|nr:hypothetical protein [bacterium]
MSDANVIQEIVLLPVVFGFFAWLFKLYFDGKKYRLKTDIHHKVVDKFSEGSQLTDFFQGESGAGFLKSLSVPSLKPKEQLLASIAKGIVIIFLGLSFLMLGMMYGEDSRVFYSLGLITLIPGIGFIVSSLVSIKLSKKWGILPGDAAI